MIKRLLLLISILIFITSSPYLFSQSTGKVSGKITDLSTGEEIPFANVFVEGTQLGAAADVNGNYVILNIPPGLYSITASVVGYQKVTVNEVRVNVDFTTRLNFELSSGAIDLPPVIIQGERNPLIRQDLTNPTVAITEESIQELPVDQISDVISLQAGVVTDNDGSLHIRGGYGNEIAYTLNGISLNDPYGNARSVGLATNAVQEVSISTGTFAAQYGNALSGVVNYVTKEGGEKYTFSIRGYMGDYWTDRTALFSPRLGGPFEEGITVKKNDDGFYPLNRGRIEGTLGGLVPFLQNAKFYVSSIYENFGGSIYGIKLYNPTDSYLSPDNFRTGDNRKKLSTDPYYFNPYQAGSNGESTGDSSYIPMNDFYNINFQGNISYSFSALLKIKYEAVYEKQKRHGRSSLAFTDNLREYLFNPAGRGYTYDDALIQSLDITHTINDKMFYTLKGSWDVNQKQYYLYESPFDPGYLPSLYRLPVGNTIFLSGGTDNYREWRKTTTYGLKGDMVAQLFNTHEFKFGFEVRKHKLEFDGYSVIIGKISGGPFNEALFNSDLLYDSSLVLERAIPSDQSRHTTYLREPLQLSAYIQDKMELAQTFILNAGLRYEYFDPNAQFNPQLSLNLIEEQDSNITKYNISSEVKHTLSPRISVSYPITDKGIIRLSYGHFYQVGSLSSLYRNPTYFVTNIGETPTFGNPNVEPQKSIQYEIGLQQQLTDDFKFDLTGFYKDVSNYIFTQTIYTAQGRAYSVLTNLSYSNIRGITLSFFKRRSPGGMFSATLDYTFSIAEGNRTEPKDEIFFSEQSGKLSETFLVPLSFDRSHVINGSIVLTEPNDWTAGVTLNFQTGTPYFPALPSNLVDIRYQQNSGNQPIQWNVDLKLEKYFSIGPIDYSVFLQVENLFDTQNELSVYTSSGRALSNVEQVQSAFEFSDLRRRINNSDPGLFGLDVIDNYYSARPERVNRPREVRIGFSVLFN